MELTSEVIRNFARELEGAPWDFSVLQKFSNEYDIPVKSLRKLVDLEGDTEKIKVSYMLGFLLKMASRVYRLELTNSQCDSLIAELQHMVLLVDSKRSD